MILIIIPYPRCCAYESCLGGQSGFGKMGFKVLQRERMRVIPTPRTGSRGPGNLNTRIGVHIYEVTLSRVPFREETVLCTPIKYSCVARDRLLTVNKPRDRRDKKTRMT